ncbi:conserved Plasmodium protein, unknown function [Plasmodium malariae]|nr:conserved Plasmodium protein, unknown function [Plasmodium malariae]SCP03414.1 conserved Plasmodium protein, unknown function [Plasmodium malariae]
MFVLKVRMRKLGRRNEKNCFSTVSNKSSNFINKNERERNVSREKFSFPKEKFDNFKQINVKNLNNREFLYYIGYGSKNKLLNLDVLNSIMQELQIKVINSINCITTDFNQNEKNILNSKCYQTEGNTKNPFFDIHDLVKVYLNICYINSYFFLKKKYEERLDKIKENVLNKERNNMYCSEGRVFAESNLFSKKTINNVKRKGVIGIEKEIKGKKEEKGETKKSGESELTYNSNSYTSTSDLFEKDHFIYTNISDKDYEHNEFVCNEYVKNIFNILSIFFLQNINILNNHYLCRLFYGYNKSKFYNGRYFNNLCFEIIKRVKKIRTYHLYLILMNSYYLNYIDSIFVKIVLINTISKLSQLPCEAICQVIPVVPLFISSEKLFFKINVIYSKKIASFNQISHLINLFKKMVQYNLISQKNIFLTFKYLNKFMKVKKSLFKTSNFKNKNVKEESTKKTNVHEFSASNDDSVINNLIENFDTFTYEDNKKKKNIMEISLDKNSLKDNNLLTFRNVNAKFKNGNVYTKEVNGELKNENFCITEEEEEGAVEVVEGVVGEVVEDTLENAEEEYRNKSELIRYNENYVDDTTESTYKKEKLFFNLKIIEMHLKHDFKSIYCLFPNDYKNFLQKVKNISCTFNKNMQGEKLIYILKKYMKMLNYKFITFTHGPYILHICDPFHKIYLDWKNGWKLYPSYEQVSQKNFEMNKINHLKKEGFNEILICHDSFTKCQNEQEKLKYLNCILRHTKFSKCTTIMNEKGKFHGPLELMDIYV